MRHDRWIVADSKDAAEFNALIILPLRIRRVVRRITRQTHKDRANIKLIPASVGRDEFSNLLIDPTTNRNLLEGQSSTDNMQKAMALGKFIINMIKSQPKPNPKPDPK